MSWITPRLRSAVALTALLALVGLGAGRAVAEKGEKKPAVIKVLVTEPRYQSTKLTIKIGGKDIAVEQEGRERTITTKKLAPGKKYTYKFEAVIVPNNYTTITRTRTISVKAGDKVTLDMTKDSKKDPDRDRVVIRWVPTPKDIAKKLGELGKITKDDVVYDLGCGDGIMIITAVKELGAKKGVGIDRDDDRIKEAKDAAKKAGLTGRIEIRKGDILDVKDMSDANVVMLYLADEMNIRLRPMLWKSLKPGSRVVSHRFLMGDWKPNKSITVKGEDGDEYDLHLWIITGKEGKKGKK